MLSKVFDKPGERILDIVGRQRRMEEQQIKTLLSRLESL